MEERKYTFYDRYQKVKYANITAEELEVLNIFYNKEHYMFDQQHQRNNTVLFCGLESENGCATDFIADSGRDIASDITTEIFFKELFSDLTEKEKKIVSDYFIMGKQVKETAEEALSSLGFKGGSRSETELNQWVQSEKEKLAMVMRENEIEWDQKGTHEPHLSVLDYKKKVREQEVEELTEHKNLLEHDLHDISECVDEIQKEKEQAEKERDAVIKKTEVLEKRFSALNSKAGLVDSHAREYGYYPEEWLPEAGTLESAKSYRKRIFPLVKKVANMIQALYSKYLELKSKNQKLSDRNIDLENRVDRLREEISVIKKENVALLNVAYDMDRVVAVLGENKVKEAIEVAKHLEQVNAKQKGKKRRTDREGR